MKIVRPLFSVWMFHLYTIAWNEYIKQWQKLDTEENLTQLLCLIVFIVQAFRSNLIRSSTNFEENKQIVTRLKV